MTGIAEERSAANKESSRTRQEVEAQSMTRKSDFGYNWNIRNEPQDSELDEVTGGGVRRKHLRRDVALWED